jgi:hypothetical protein
MNRVFRTIATLAVATAVATTGFLVVGAPANADDTTAVARVKVEISRRIDLRLAALNRFDTTTAAARHLTDAHKSTLHALISQDTSGLTALKTKVNGETTLAALRTDATSMVNDYRIFLLVGPKVRLTVAGDTEDFAVGRLHTAHDTLATLLAKAKSAGKDTTAAEQNLADMQSDLDKASAAINGQVATLLDLQPGPDGPGITSKVTTVRTALHTGRTDLADAVAKAKLVRDFLRSIK